MILTKAPESTPALTSSLLNSGRGRGFITRVCLLPKQIMQLIEPR
jgi:hypothetical protein